VRKRISNSSGENGDSLSHGSHFCGKPDSDFAEKMLWIAAEASTQTHALSGRKHKAAEVDSRPLIPLSDTRLPPRHSRGSAVRVSVMVHNMYKSGLLFDKNQLPAAFGRMINRIERKRHRVVKEA
jgi:hypothetical protein